MTEIKLENVSYAYDEQQILKDISLEVKAGQVVAILGPSGVGKTTLFNLIAGILEVQSGRIVLDGQENPKGRVRRTCYWNTRQCWAMSSCPC